MFTHSNRNLVPMPLVILFITLTVKHPNMVHILNEVRLFMVELNTYQVLVVMLAELVLGCSVPLLLLLLELCPEWRTQTINSKA